nr:formate dehydrogenase accessory sulfurtransferase FdhD [Bosea sp. FBZP-16]
MPRNSPPAQPPASHAVQVRTVRFGPDDQVAAASAEVAVEAPVNIVYGTMPYAVMMATPSDLEDFVAGFSLTEGIVRNVDEIRGITVAPQQNGIVVSVELAPGRFREHLARRRNLSGRTSCGLCGVEALADLPKAEARAATATPIAPAAIGAALGALERQQPLHRLTRSVHAAAWCDRDGEILAVREDVGRHNALDKLIGARLRAGHDASDGFVLVTSRASFEMVEKAAIFGAGALVSISAPTSLAIERANALGLTLVCIARADSATVFAGRLAESVESVAR